MIAVSFLGDSITDAGGASDRKNLGYVNVLAKIFPLISKKYAVGGARIAKDNGINHENNFLDRALTMDNDTDYVFVMGGTNDFGHGFAPLGDINSTDEYTFSGACNTLMKLLIDKFTNKKLCFILPLPRFDEDKADYTESTNTVKRRARLETYRTIIRNLAKRYNIEVLDLSLVFNDIDKMTADGVHPNDYGHEIIAKELVAFLKQKGFR